MEQTQPGDQWLQLMQVYMGVQGSVRLYSFFLLTSMVMISLLQPMVKSSSYVAGDRRSKYALIRPIRPIRCGSATTNKIHHTDSSSI